MARKKKASSALSMIAVLIAFVLGYFASNDPSVGQTLNLGGQATQAGVFAKNYDGDGYGIHFIDVGQGDSILLQFDGMNILIDAGLDSKGTDVVSYLSDAGVEALDYIVASHPHADHIGGLPQVMDTFKTGQLLMPDTISIHTPTTKTFENLLVSANENDVPIRFAQFGIVIEHGNAKLEFFGPISISSNYNNCSAIILFTYYNDDGTIDTYMLTGDAEKEQEKELLAVGIDISATVLKAGHHGSSTSSTEDFLTAVGASYAVISCGENNSYGHPTEITLDKFEQFNLEVYRTDLNGNIIFHNLDGGVIEIETSKQPTID